MKFLPKVFHALLLVSTVFAQGPKSVTVPITLDHNRVVIDVYLPLPDGTTKRVRAWVDTGSTEMTTSQRVGELFGLVNCDAQTCTTSLPRELTIGGMKISLARVQSAHAPAGVPKDVMAPGMSPEINLPATILHNYDVVFDYANRQFTIGEPGSVKFQGTPIKAAVNQSGLIQVPAQVLGESLPLLLDSGSGISFIASDRFGKWHMTYPSWPYMKGAAGAANLFGTPDEPERQLLRLPGLKIGASTLQGVIVASFPPDLLKRLNERAGAEVSGLLGGEAFRNCRIGIDYAHQTVYIEPPTRSPAPDMDVVGLTLRPEPDGKFTILSVLEVKGRPAIPEVKAGDILLGIDGAPASGATLGQVWSLLGGTPGQTRSLTLERDGKRFTVDAPVQRFLDAKTSAPTRGPRKNPHRRN
ncbi:MAG TPA: hypothetical protein VLL05_07160 [Terriglobales bacterium]|nr:hypothetical protein [Terriglobales bacterium]